MTELKQLRDFAEQVNGIRPQERSLKGVVNNLIGNYKGGGGSGNSVAISGFCDFSNNKGSMKAFIDGNEIELQELQSDRERECLYSMNVPLNKEIEIWYIADVNVSFSFRDFYFNGEGMNIEPIIENNIVKFKFTFTYGGYLSLEVLGAD